MSVSQPAILPDGKPWNPQRLLPLMFFLTTIAAGIAYGLNWRKLGKPQWTTPTIALSIAIPVIGLGIGFATLSVGLEAGNYSFLPMLPIFLAAGLNFGYVFALWYLQNGAFQKYDKTGDVTAMLNHEYNLRNAGLIVIGAAVAMGAFGAFLMAMDA